MVRRMNRALVMFTVIAGTLAASTVYAQTVDEIVAKHYASRGGAAKWKTIQTQKISGTVAAGGVELAMTHYSKRPHLGRQELTVEIPGQGPIAITNIFDGTTAWTTNPMTGSTTPQPVTGREAEMMKEQSDFEGPLIEYKAKGHTVELVGAETLGTNKVHHLKVTRKGQPASHHYLDVETGVERQITNEGDANSIVELSDYRAVDGVQVPFRIRVIQGGQVAAEVTVTSIAFNVPIDDSMFKVK